MITYIYLLTQIRTYDLSKLNLCLANYEMFAGNMSPDGRAELKTNIYVAMNGYVNQLN